MWSTPTSALRAAVGRKPWVSLMIPIFIQTVYQLLLRLLFSTPFHPVIFPDFFLADSVHCVVCSRNAIIVIIIDLQESNREHQRERVTMPTLIVRNIDEETKTRLALRAAGNGRSTEAEVRAILREVTREESWISDWIENTPRFSDGEFILPTRSRPRNQDLFGDKAQ